MLDNLPDELLRVIIGNLEDNNIHGFLEMEIQTILDLKQINRFLKSFIENLQGLWTIIPENKESLIVIKRKRTEDIDRICRKKVPVTTIEWLMKNNLFLSLPNIKSLIIYNRIDIIKAGFFYKEFLDVLFNRFYIDDTKYNEIFSITETINPVIIAAKFKRLEIIKLLLELNNHGNPFRNMIPSLLDIAIKYSNKSLISYIILNFFDNIKSILPSRLMSIFHRINKSEDIFFYLLQTNKIEINNKLLIGSIKKGYYDLFIYCFNNESYNGYSQDLIVKSIDNNSIKILNYILECTNISICPYIFSDTIFSKNKNNKDFIENIIDHHLNLIPKNYPLIQMSIDMQINNERIVSLITKDYVFNKENIIQSINTNFQLAKVMVNHYNADNADNEI